MYDFRPMGDRGILINFTQIISPEIAARIGEFVKRAADGNHKAIVEFIPAYASVCVVYDPLAAGFEEMRDYCTGILDTCDAANSSRGSLFEIPVLYNQETGPDLEFVSEYSGLSTDEVIQIHTAEEYLIYMLGFVPGFCYLGGMDERIAVPRLKIPRQKITPGSVGIAGSQTGMYPVDSPGGWQIIGRTPLKLYDPLRTPPVYYGAGDYIQYKAITGEEFEHIKALEDKGEYIWVSRTMKRGE